MSFLVDDAELLCSISFGWWVTKSKHVIPMLRLRPLC